MVAGVTGAWTTDVIEAAHQRDVQACTPADGAEAPQPGTIAIFKGEAAPKSFNEENDEVKGLDWSLRTKSPIECFPSTAKAFTVRRALLPLLVVQDAEEPREGRGGGLIKLLVVVLKLRPPLVVSHTLLPPLPLRHHHHNRLSTSWKAAAAATSSRPLSCTPSSASREEPRAGDECQGGSLQSRLLAALGTD